jgi:hypothetical protein
MITNTDHVLIFYSGSADESLEKSFVSIPLGEWREENVNPTKLSIST